MVQQPTPLERKKLIREGFMVEEMKSGEVKDVVDPWQLELKQRWRLYKYWMKIFTLRSVISYNLQVAKKFHLKR